MSEIHILHRTLLRRVHTSATKGKSRILFLTLEVFATYLLENASAALFIFKIQR